MLKEARERKGITIAELSRRSNVSRWMINLIEKKGYTKAKPETWSKLAIALGVEVNEIK